MSLSGAPVLVVAVAFALAATLAVVLLWPRLSGGGAWHYLGRTGVLLVQNLTLLLALGVGMNDTFQFFADWSDLAGALGGQQLGQDAASGGAGPAGRTTQGTPGEAPRTSSSAPAVAAGLHGQLVDRQGDVERFRVGGGPSGVSADVYVALPADYDRLVHDGHRFPVIEAFSGYPSTPRQWLGVMGLERSLTTLAAAREIAEPLVVLPTVELPPGTDTECVDGGPAGAQVERWVAGDVPTWVSSTLPVLHTQSAWATIGLSTGGYCATMAAMLHPDVFGAAMSFAGYYRPEFESGYRPFAAGSAAAARYDLAALARRDPPPVAVWALTSEADTLSYPSTRRLLLAARRPLSVQVETLLHAGHRTAVLKPWVPTALRWLARSEPGFAPAP